jgi:hypothetical protein
MTHQYLPLPLEAFLINRLFDHTDISTCGFEGRYHFLWCHPAGVIGNGVDLSRAAKAVGDFVNSPSSSRAFLPTSYHVTKKAIFERDGSADVAISWLVIVPTSTRMVTIQIGDFITGLL